MLCEEEAGAEAGGAMALEAGTVSSAGLETLACMEVCEDMMTVVVEECLRMTGTASNPVLA